MLVIWIGLKGTKKNSVPLFRFSGLMMHEQEGQRYIAFYNKKMCTAIMHIHCTKNMNMPKYFRTELRQFASGMRRTVKQDINKRGDNSLAGKHPLFLHIYIQILKIMYYTPNPDNICSRALLTMEWPLMARDNNCVHFCVNYIE